MLVMYMLYVEVIREVFLGSLNNMRNLHIELNADKTESLALNGEGSLMYDIKYF
jgi:hypothetical protein